MNIFDSTKRKAEEILSFLGKADREIKRKEDIKAFFRVLLAMILVIIVASVVMISIWTTFSSSGTFMRIIAGTVVVLLLIPSLFIIAFTYKKFIKK